jgi:hypothetical protein
LRSRSLGESVGKTNAINTGHFLKIKQYKENTKSKALFLNCCESLYIRIVRNDIAHKYHTEKLKDIYKKVLELTPFLLNCVEDIREYCKKRYKIGGL